MSFILVLVNLSKAIAFSLFLSILAVRYPQKNMAFTTMASLMLPFPLVLKQGGRCNREPNSNIPTST